MDQGGKKKTLYVTDFPLELYELQVCFEVKLITPEGFVEVFIYRKLCLSFFANASIYIMLSDAICCKVDIWFLLLGFFTYWVDDRNSCFSLYE